VRLTEGIENETPDHTALLLYKARALRELQNYVVNSTTGETIYTPPPAVDVPILMAELVEWLNRKRETHPVLVSDIAQFQLVHIHPFLDGNGRTSRLISTLCLYRAG